MFVDQADIEVLAGDGGRGCVSFRKEKYIPLGGPDGGDGGDGGSVYLQATPGVDTLLDMTGRHHWRAQPGEPGLGKKKAGGDGKDLIIRVPPGTIIYDRTSGLLIADLKAPGQQVCIAKGGRGGKGNVHFMNAVRQAPDFAEPGKKGQTRSIHLELRLIADVGVVGLPNAGKSTLLSRISHARPKIAAYPFTTLVPQLGIAELDAERRLVIADIPGLIEGAHEGAGLGLDFLRHIERTRVIIHIIDILPLDGSSPIKAYKQIRAELKAYSPKLAAKHEILAANKMDLAGASEALADLRQALPGKQIFAISAVAGTGLRPLLEALWQQVKNAPESAPLVEERPYIPPPDAAKRSEKEMFVYTEAEGDEADWEPVDGDEALAPVADNFIDAQGDLVPPPKDMIKKKREKRRLLVEDAPRKKGRTTAKERKTAHEDRVQRDAAARASTAAVSPAPARTAGVSPAVSAGGASPASPPSRRTKPAPAEDPALAAEIAAMKADDARKGKYYNTKKLT
ncbi:MAG TPA: GTPase ObgE [Phycisphaerae bacterium]|nr:GTPase ObgE [Phycisphaerae bacterium]